MDLRNLPLIGGRLIIFIANIFILSICIFYIQLIYSNNIIPDKHVKENFTQITCTVTAKKMSERGSLIHHYRADFLISYPVNGKIYQAWVTGNGLDQGFFRDKTLQEETLTSFDVGGTYPCWYNPKFPQQAVLVMRHNWSSTLPLAVPTVIAIIAIYYILKGTFQFLGLISFKTRDILKKNRGTYNGKSNKKND